MLKSRCGVVCPKVKKKIYVQWSEFNNSTFIRSMNKRQIHIVTQCEYYFPTKPLETEVGNQQVYSVKFILYELGIWYAYT